MANQSESQPSPLFVSFDEDELTGSEALRELEQTLEAQPNEVDLVVAAEQPTPVGKSYAFDWVDKRFITAPSGPGGNPMPTYGYDTLSHLIEKALRTGQGAHPVCPPSYGIPPTSDPLFGSPVGQVPTDLEDRVRQAVLSAHPRISAVEDFSYDYDENQEFLAVDFVVRLDDDSVVPLTIRDLSDVVAA